MARARGKCPKCQTAFDVEVEPDEFFLCPGCGARLKSRRRPAAEKPGAVTMKLKAAAARSKTQGEPPAPAPAAPSPTVPAQAPPSPKQQAAPAGASPSGPSESSSVEELMYALYQVQKQILDILQSRLPSASGPTEASEGPPAEDAEEGLFTALPPAPARARRRKTVLLVDDEAASRDAALAALQAAEVPTRSVGAVDETIKAISDEKPDVVALELDLGGDRSGKDLIDMIKATIEWINIPIVLYTRVAIQSLQEARTTHGADAFVIKGPHGAEALVSAVITLFRKH
jgi:CheY-like chemotaxis protein